VAIKTSLLLRLTCYKDRLAI